MKRLLLLLAFLCCCVGSSFAAPAWVRGNSCTTSATSVSCAFTSNAAGNLISACSEINNATSSATIADTAGNTYTAVYAMQLAGSGSQMVGCWYAKNIAASAGTNTVTITDVANTFRELSINEYSGLDTSAPFRSSNFATPSGTTASSGTFAVVVGDLVIGYALDAGGGITAGSGFTGRSQAISALLMEDELAGSTTGNATFNGASAAWGVIGFALIPAGGGPPASHTPTLPEMGVGMATLNPNNIVPLIGISSVVAASLPPVGGRNQVHYLEMSIDSLFKYGLLVPDKSDDITLSASKSFAANYMRMANGYKLVGFNSPLVDYAEMVLKIETVKGVTNWIAVENDLNIITDFAFVQDWIKPGTAKVSQVKAFMLEFTHIVDNYNHGY